MITIIMSLFVFLSMIPIIFITLDLSINGSKNGGDNLWLAIPFKKIKKDINNNYLD